MKLHALCHTWIGVDFGLMPLEKCLYLKVEGNNQWIQYELIYAAYKRILLHKCI